MYPPDILPESVVRFEVRQRRTWSRILEPGPQLFSKAIPHFLLPDQAEAAMRAIKLVGMDADDKQVADWSFWECLSWETDLDGHRVILHDGTWFQIKDTFRDEVDAFVRTLQPSGLVFPEWTPEDDEGEYNEAAAEEMGWALLDKRLIKLDGRSSVEPCDLVAPSGHTIHVKKRKGGSGPLSHLIGQAVVAGSLLKHDRDFRDAFRDRLREARSGLETIVTEPVDLSRLPVVLALITTGTRGARIGEALPFFTKVFLMQNVQRLRDSGYDVYLDAIAAGPVPTGRAARTAKRTKKRRSSGAVPASPARPRRTGW
jgi:uncharacterized protein (TIGR04141 family)